MKLPSKETIAPYREGCYSQKKPEGNENIAQTMILFNEF